MSHVPDVEPGLPRALERLSDKQRTAVWLVYGLEWQQTEVAELLGISAETGVVQDTVPSQVHAVPGVAC